MKATAENRFVYVTYIRTTPERLWSALTSDEFARQYWLGIRPEKAPSSSTRPRSAGRRSCPT
jgi:uncharacterized protein YndB with AHSA1/START domain